MPKRKQESGWGGSRPGAGRGAGDKTKISVSVDEENWQAALAIWQKRPSWLVDGLIADYVEGNEKHAERLVV